MTVLWRQKYEGLPKLGSCKTTFIYWKRRINSIKVLFGGELIKFGDFSESYFGWTSFREPSRFTPIKSNLLNLFVESTFLKIFELIWSLWETKSQQKFLKHRYYHSWRNPSVIFKIDQIFKLQFPRLKWSGEICLRCGFSNLFGDILASAAGLKSPIWRYL